MTKPAPITAQAAHHMEPGGPWLILRTNKRAEGVVISQLRPDEYEYYRPMAAKVVTVKGISGPVIKGEPVYPGFLFVRRLSTMRTSLTSLRGVKVLLTYGVADEVIKGHQAREVDGFIHLISNKETPSARLAKGAKVKTLDGLLDLVVEEVIAGNRVRCLSTFLGSGRMMTVGLDKIIRTDA